MPIKKIDDAAKMEQRIRGRYISNLMLMIWQSRKHLQSAFDLKTMKGQQGYLDWCDVALIRPPDRLFYAQLLGAAGKKPGVFRWLPSWLRRFANRIRFKLRVQAARFTAMKNQPENPPIEKTNFDRPAAAAPKIEGVPGANLVGYADAELGLGEHVRMSGAAFAQTDVAFGIFNFGIGTESRRQARLRHGSPIASNIHKANLFHISPDQMLTAFGHLGREFFSDRYNIGYWLWELSKCPDEWLPVMGFVDEIWAPSRFIQRAFAERTDLPVKYMPLCVTLPSPEGRSRESFGLPKDRYLFLFSFDFFSFIDRKNPFAVIAAFKRAFPDIGTKVGLAIKTMNGDVRHPRWKHMLELVADDPRIVVLNRTMTRDEVIGLFDVCDSFVSLHRSEGFGFGPAEAMSLGKPVIATNYSGNTDFTLPDNSCPVDYKLVPVTEGQYIFDRGQVWADPDIEHAAWYMRKLASESAYGAELGKRAAAFMRENHGPAKIGSLYRKRLKELNLA